MQSSITSTTTPVLKQFECFLDKAAGLHEPNSLPRPLPPSLRVGIVGGGMAGLYSALLLQKHFPGVQVKILEASNRVGGCFHTHRFSQEPYQYFEGGPMRLPENLHYKPVFDLIDYLNNEFPTDPIKLIDFEFLCLDGNRVFVNNKKQKDGRIMSLMYALQNYKELGFPEEVVADGNAASLLTEAMEPIADAFRENFENALKKYGHMSSYEYFRCELGWNFQKIIFVETMLLQTNAFYFDVLIAFCYTQFFDFQTTWKTIDQGVSKLPEKCAEAVLKSKGDVILNAKVESICHLDKTVRIGYSQPKCEDLSYEEFDAVIMAIPCPHI